MIKGRGPREMIWDSVPGAKASVDVDYPESTPKFWACANCRTLEPVANITLIGKIPLCQECCGSKQEQAIPAGGVEEIIDRILSAGREKLSNTRKARHPRAKRQSKVKPLKN